MSREGGGTVDDIMYVAKQRAAMHGVRNILVATKGTGATARRARRVFGGGYTIYAVGNPPSSYDRGFCLHTGITREKRAELQSQGIQVVLQDYSVLQGSRAIAGGELFDFSEREIPHNQRLDQLIEAIRQGRDEVIMTIIFNAFCWFGEGGKVCMEIALMAAESGALPLDELCVAIATPADLAVPDACLVFHPAKTEALFTWDFCVADFTQMGKVTPLFVNNLAASLTFYRDVIGLVETPSSELPGYAELKLGSGRLALAEETLRPIVSERFSCSLDARLPGEQRLLFSVRSVEDVRARLATATVPLEPGDQARVTRFRDPDGNVVEIM
jgi:catechol 2,3-dioxygenase-like lactoylglutathione lyase family enzyme